MRGGTFCPQFGRLHPRGAAMAAATGVDAHPRERLLSPVRVPYGVRGGHRGGGQRGHGPPYAQKGGQHVFCPPPPKHRMALFREVGPFGSDCSEEPKPCRISS